MTRRRPLAVPVYLLAGGKSSRFGSDKARAMLGGAPLIRHVADALRPIAATVTVVADQANKYADLNLRTIADVRPGLGPLGGLATALSDRNKHQGTGWLLLASCDLAEPRADWVQPLLEQATDNHRAVLFCGERVEPLLALYHTDLMPLAEERLRRGEGAMWRFAEAAGCVKLPLPESRPRLPQINTPGDLDNWDQSGCS